MADKFVVIGSNSFSGSHFVAYLLEQGFEVLGISRSEEPDPIFLPYRWKDDRGSSFKFLALDLNRDGEKIADEIIHFAPRYIVNFAALGMVAESWDFPLDYYQTNLLAHIALHERLRKYTGLEKYVHVSTPEVYGSCQAALSEDQVFNPSTPYAASRAACELHLRTFINQHHFPVVFTRAANVYGPGQQLYRIIPRTVLSALLGRMLPLHGGGKSVRSFIHIRDVAEGTLLAATKGMPREVFHFSTELHLSIRALVEKICTIAGVNFDEVARIVDERAGKDDAYLLDTARARKTLGWTPRIGLDEGLDEMFAWTRANLDILKSLPSNYVHKV